jgi:hypothetical protein
MLAAVTGDLYAAVSGRKLVVDWSDYTYSNDKSNVFPKLFHRSGGVEALPDLHDRSVDPPIWIERLDLEVSDLIEATDPADHNAVAGWRKYSTDLTRLDQPERVLVFWSYTEHIRLIRRHFAGPWKDWSRLSDDAIVAKVLRDRLLLSAAIRAQVDAFKEKHFGGETIGVHVRYMDRRTSIADFLKRLDRVTSARPEAAIFLATDNKRAELTIRDRYRRVIASPKWFPEGGVSMHQNSECPDRLTNAVEALVDMYLLAECDWLIFPGSSTFSRIASLVGTMPRSQVIDIERFNPRVRAKRLYKAFMQ